MHNVPDNYELVVRNPVAVYRKIQATREDNNKLNEYHYYKDGELSDISYPSISDAIVAHDKGE